MKKILFVSFCTLFIAGCLFARGSRESFLTRDRIQEIIDKSTHQTTYLIAQTYIGCERVPSKNWIHRIMIGLEFTGETCFVTIHTNQTVTVSFLGPDPYFLVEIVDSDLFVSQIDENSVLLVQHHEQKVVSATYTKYDRKGRVKYGVFGSEDSLKECLVIDSSCSK